MNEKNIFELRDLVSCTVHNLLLITADIKRELIVVYFLGKEIELPVDELWSCKNSCRGFISYLKDKLGVGK